MRAMGSRNGGSFPAENIYKGAPVTDLKNGAGGFHYWEARLIDVSKNPTLPFQGEYR